jgi:hypothetical protein
MRAWPVLGISEFVIPEVTPHRLTRHNRGGTIRHESFMEKGGKNGPYH